jgi:hypothetical protein
MVDETDKQTEAIHRTAEFRERAARYESLAVEARHRGDTQMSIEFETMAAKELTEASHVESDIGKE